MRPVYDAVRFDASFTSALGPSAIGIERDPSLARHGRSKHGPFNVTVADAILLPLREGSADVAIASLLLHQVARVEVLGEIARVLRPSGRLVIRTVAPDDAAARVPHRWFPTVAEAQRRRMPSIRTLREECVAAGMRVVAVAAVERERTIAAADAELSVHHEVLARYELPEVRSKPVSHYFARQTASDTSVGHSHARRSLTGQKACSVRSDPVNGLDRPPLVAVVLAGAAFARAARSSRAREQPSAL